MYTSANLNTQETKNELTIFWIDRRQGKISQEKTDRFTTNYFVFFYVPTMGFVVALKLLEKQQTHSLHPS